MDTSRVLDLIEQGFTVNSVSDQTGFTRTQIANILAEAYLETIQTDEEIVEESYREKPSDLEISEECEDDSSKTISVKYSGKIKKVEEILEEIGLNENEWTVSDIKYNEWQGQRPKDQGLVTLRQVKFYLKKVGTLSIEGTSLQPVTINMPKKALKTRHHHDVKCAVVIPDIQCGFRRNMITGQLESLHDRRALEVAVQMVAELQPDRIVFLGDNLDLAEFSTKFNPTPEHYFTTQAALVELAWWLASFKNVLDKETELCYLGGNHELRLGKFLAEKANQVYALRSADNIKGAPVLSIQNLLGLDRMDITYHEYPSGVVKINKNLVCVHGEIAKNASGATTAELVKKYNYSVIQGHIHRYEVASKTNWDASGNPNIVTSASFGCLCKLDPGVVPGTTSLQNWQQGIGIVSYEDSGLERFSHEFIPIQNGEAIFHGNVYKAESEASIVKEIESSTNFKVS